MSESKFYGITMPKWGMAMEEGTVVAWHVAEGAAVNVGTEIVDVESTKATAAVEAKRAGVLLKRVAEVGTSLPVGALIGVIGDADVLPSEVEQFIATHRTKSGDGSTEGPPRSKRVALGGNSVNVFDFGAGEPPYLLIHGFGGTLQSWSLLQSDLAEDRRVIAFDLPGHGDTSATLTSWSLEELASTTLALIDALALQSVHMVGHSLGGAIAILAAAMAPERVRSLTLIASAGFGREIDNDYIQGFINAGRRKDLAPVVGKLFADPKFMTRAMLEDIVRMKRIDGVNQALRQIADGAFPAGVQARTDLHRVLETSKVPAQVIWGAEDSIIPARHAENAGIPAVVLEAAGHMPQIEQTAAVARAIRGFVQPIEEHGGAVQE